MPQELLAPDLTTRPEENAQPMGSRCEDCGAVAWPRPSACPRCSRSKMVDRLFARHGTLVAWTTQGLVPGRAILVRAHLLSGGACVGGPTHRVGGGGRLRTLPARDVDGYLYADLDAAQRTG